MFIYLYENFIVVCGIVRKNRIKFLRVFIEVLFVKGEYSFRRNGDLLIVRFNDKKEIYFLLIIYKANMVNIGRRDR